MNNKVEISAIVPVCDRFYDRTGTLIGRYLDELDRSGRTFELVYVLDGEYPELARQIVGLASNDRRIRVIQLARKFGEATALTAGFEHTEGEVVLTLPAYFQVEPSDIGKVLAEVPRYDVVVGARTIRPGPGSFFKSVRRRAYHRIVRGLIGKSFTDLGCAVRALNRSVVKEIAVHGDQFRFIALLALRSGFRTKEVVVNEPEFTQSQGKHGPALYLGRLMDVFTLTFSIRFTKKPLRFFGTIGSITFTIGALVLAYVVFQRLVFNIPLADRPAMLLSSLLVVLGFQIFALGLLGELIIFTHGHSIKEYSIEKIIN